MFKIYSKQFISITAFITLVSFVSFSHAHDAGATMDPDGTVAKFTGYALVTCFDDGNGAADHLAVSVKDTSPPVPGLMVNMQVIKGSRAANTTDPVSGDGLFSPEVIVQGGNGVYQILVNKTNAGTRTFQVSYHCITSTNAHTGTDITVNQFE